MRRQVLTLITITFFAGCTSAPPEVKTTSVPTLISSYRVDEDAAWLDRLTWGANSSSLSDLRRSGRVAWLNAQLSPSVRLTSELQDQLDKQAPIQSDLTTLIYEMETRRKDADVLKDDTAKAAAQQAYQQALQKLAREAASRSLLLATYSPHQIQEQLTAFWFNHFNIHQYKHNVRAMVGNYEQGLRERALGRFRDLLGYTAQHPAMLRYLDNEQNAVGRLNENYARELLELHTLGVDAGYTQHDVQELARVLTGLGVNLTGMEPKLRPQLQGMYVRHGLMEFNPARHDFGDKQLLGLNIKGRGLSELDLVLDTIARHPSTRQYISRKLAQAFVADVPPPALVERMAQRWQQTDGRISEVMRVMISSPEFEKSLGRKFKDPQHYVVSAVRLAYDSKVVLNAGPMLGWLYRLGQAPFNRQTPDGYPFDESAWAGPGQLNTRFDVARGIGNGSAGLFRVDGEKVDRPAFPMLSNPLYYEGIAPRLAVATKQTLELAGSQQEWNTFLLSSPEFMHR